MPGSRASGFPTGPDKLCYVEQYKTIGEGRRASWPYQVDVHWAAPGADASRPIGLSEGTGHGSAGGNFRLSEILADVWTEHLELCDCLWLRELAREEIERGTPFSADEIWARFEARGD